MFTLDDLPEGMRAKVRVDAGCWVWSGAKNNRGYGSTTNGRGGSMLAHRKSYELALGPIPDGLTIDHICEVRACINPAHLQVMDRTLNAQMVGIRKAERIREEHPPQIGPTWWGRDVHEWLENTRRRLEERA